jgi:hypothetical protein
MTAWLSVEELAGVAFGAAPVVMANEAHDGWRRCVRTRRVGVRLVRAAHALGVRDLAMEALPAPQPRQPLAWTEQPPVEGGYLAQPDMRELTAAALAQGWRLWSYEAWTDPALFAAPEQLVTMKHTNWREREQALNLAVVTAQVPRLLVWCGNGHATREAHDDWVPMGYRYVEATGRRPYLIDQIVTVNFNDEEQHLPDGVLEALHRELGPFGGTAAVRREDADERLHAWDADAFVLSVDNAMTEYVADGGSGHETA